MSRIVVVEDNAANLELLRYLLAAHGHTVECASDGEDGLRVAKAFRPDVVLCDLQMPRLNGYGLLKKIRADPDLADMTVVAVTAYSMPGDRLRVVEAGFDGYLTKPIAPESVVVEIEGFIARRSSESQASHGTDR